MNDNITLEKLWEDDELIQLKVCCSSSVAVIVSRIYVSNTLLHELACQITSFLDGNIEEGLWANEEKGNKTSTCLEFRFLKKDKLGHIQVEVFSELDDGGDYTKHNSCFFVNTEYGLLMSFCEQLKKFVEGSTGVVQLNNARTQGDGSVC